MALVLSIRIAGWSGIALAVVSVATTNTQLFLASQVIASISAFLWVLYLQEKKVTGDLLISLALSVIAVVTKNQFFMYSAMICRSVSYQLVFERIVKKNV